MYAFFCKLINIHYINSKLKYLKKPTKSINFLTHCNKIYQSKIYYSERTIYYLSYTK